MRHLYIFFRDKLEISGLTSLPAIQTSFMPSTKFLFEENKRKIQKYELQINLSVIWFISLSWRTTNMKIWIYVRLSIGQLNRHFFCTEIELTFRPVIWLIHER